MNKALAAFGAALIYIVARNVLDLGFIGALIVTGLGYSGITAISEDWPGRLKARLERRRQDREQRRLDKASGRGRRNGRGRSGDTTSGSSTIDRTLGGDSSWLQDDTRLVELGISPEDFNEALTTGSRKLVALRKACSAVQDTAVRAKANGVCDAAARILTEIRRDPSDLRRARNFLDYYMDATINVVERYSGLAGRNLKTPEIEAALKRAEDSLETIRTAYDKQLLQLLENDVMGLDVELKVLERTIAMEGLGTQREER